MKYCITFFAILIILGCEKDHKKATFKNRDVCRLIDSLNYKDNLYRGDERIIDPFFKILDSIRLSEGISSEMYGTFSVNKQLEYGKKARKITDKLEPINQKLKDSLMLLQNKLDDQNTKILISFIKTKGYYPTKKMTGCETQPDLVFRHSNSKYFYEISKIIDEQLQKGHINEFQHRVYRQHFERVLGKKDIKSDSLIIY